MVTYLERAKSTPYETRRACLESIEIDKFLNYSEEINAPLQESIRMLSEIDEVIRSIGINPESIQLTEENKKELKTKINEWDKENKSILLKDSKVKNPFIYCDSEGKVYKVAPEFMGSVDWTIYVSCTGVSGPYTHADPNGEIFEECYFEGKAEAVRNFEMIAKKMKWTKID